MFSIFESCDSTFPETEKFEVFWCNLRRNKKILQREEFCFQVSRHLIWKLTLKKTKKQTFTRKKIHWSMQIKHAPCTPSVGYAPQEWRKIHLCAPSARKIHLAAQPCAPSVGWAGHNAFFYFLVEKAQFLSPTSGGNSPYLYHSSHS